VHQTIAHQLEPTSELQSTVEASKRQSSIDRKPPPSGGRTTLKRIVRAVSGVEQSQPGEQGNSPGFRRLEQGPASTARATPRTRPSKGQQEGGQRVRAGWRHDPAGCAARSGQTHGPIKLLEVNPRPWRPANKGPPPPLRDEQAHRPARGGAIGYRLERIVPVRA